MPTTIDRVPLNTTQAVNGRIERATGERVRRCVGNPLMIERRLRELDREWDIERVLEANASVVAFLGLALGAAVNRRWLFLPAAVTAFLFQHAVQGWCPPLPILRRLGVRTSREIEIERVALKMLRGDFDGKPAPSGGRRRSDDAIRIARA
ncbi:MAG: hypothetical protein FD144_4875 [Rhodospirillaceae bacterium]|nr:MAG: hypothetical protein FD144_4875 [Rhodospirillaceae bacterium]